MRLYELDYGSYEKKPSDLTVGKKKLTLFDLKLPGEKCNIRTLVTRWIFALISKGGIEIYYVTEAASGEIIHSSSVMGRSLKFPFMGDGDIHIGPCITSPDYRGRGIYKQVLRFINGEKQESCQRAYMLVSEGNLPSIKGIEASGFRQIGTVEKSKILKIYRECNDV